jgi:error-prone DNA polymerase
MQIAMVGAGYTPGRGRSAAARHGPWRKPRQASSVTATNCSTGFARAGISAPSASSSTSRSRASANTASPSRTRRASRSSSTPRRGSRSTTPRPSSAPCSTPSPWASTALLARADAQRHGVRCARSRSSTSRWDATLEPPASPPGHRSPRRAMRLGLRLVKGWARTRPSIVNARDRAPFTTRSRIWSTAQAEEERDRGLAEAGALTPSIPERRDALWRPARRGKGASSRACPSRARKTWPAPHARAPAARLDYGRVGLSLHDHPMKHLREELRRRGVRRAEELRSLRDGSTVRVAGW